MATAPAAEGRATALALTRTSGNSVARALAAVQLSVSGGTVALGCVLGWFVARWAGSRGLFLLVYLAVIALVVAWVSGRRSPEMVVDRSDVSGRLREGQVIDIEIVISTRRRARTVVVTEEVDPALGRDAIVPVADLGPEETLTHRYSLRPERRGVFEIGPSTATWSDPFGLSIHRQRLAEPIEVLVHPSTELVVDRIVTRMWEDPEIRPPQSMPWPTGSEFYGMRDYVAGDDIRRVVWSAVAKTGRMLVRESEQGVADTVTLVLDTDRDWQSPGDVSASFEHAVRTIASLARYHVDLGLRVHVLTNEGALASSTSGRDGHLPILDALARVMPSKAPLAATAPHLLQASARGCHVVIITPRLDVETAALVRVITDRGSATTVGHLSWEEADPGTPRRAAAAGATVVRVPIDAPVAAAFRVGAGR